MVPLKVGLVGCGRLAERGWIPALRMAEAAGTALLVAVAEPDPSRRAAAAQAASVESSFADWRELIASGCADAVVLAIGGREQLEPARAATAAGLAVLVEKPPGGDREGAGALARLRPPPAVGFSRRFDPAWRALRDAARAPSALELRLAYRRSGWGAHVVRDDALSDLGSHVADLAAWIGGGPVVRARCTRLEPETAEGELELDGGSARFAVATDRPYSELGRLDGAARVRRGGWWRNALGRFGAGPDAAALPRSLAAELAAFAAGDRDVAGAADGVRCHAVLDALRDSAGRGGAWVAVTVAP